MNFKAVVFDLDGTLVDSHGSIYHSTIQTLIELNIDCKIDEKIFKEMIGLHFRDIFRKFKIHVKDVDQFIEIYKGHYFEFISKSKRFSGVAEVLKKLHTQDIKVGLLTTKGQQQAEQIAEHFDISNYFNLIKGWLPGEEIKPSPKPLLEIGAKLKVDAADLIMVGDAEIDVQCGKNAGSKTCAVTYGYRSKEALLFEQPDFTIDSINNILPILLNNQNARD